MLLRMLPDQVSEQWDIFREAIKAALPPVVDDHEDLMNRLLMAALLGKLDVWVSYHVNKEGVKVSDGVVSTEILRDDLDGINLLVVYSLYSFGNLSRTGFSEILDALIKYGKSRNCSGMIAFSQLDVFDKTVLAKGGDVSFKLLKIPFV